MPGSGQRWVREWQGKEVVIGGSQEVPSLIWALEISSPAATGVGRWGRGGIYVDTYRQVYAGACPIRLALTTRILSVWLTRRPRPRLRAPTAEMRLLLQQKDICILLPSEQLCRARWSHGPSWCCWCIHLLGLHVPASTDASGTLGRSVCKSWITTLVPSVEGDHSASTPGASLPYFPLPYPPPPTTLGS